MAPSSRRQTGAEVPATDNKGAAGVGHVVDNLDHPINRFWLTAPPQLRFVAKVLARDVERDFGMSFWHYLLSLLAQDRRIRLYYDRAYASWFEVMGDDALPESDDGESKAQGG